MTSNLGSRTNQGGEIRDPPTPFFDAKNSAVGGKLEKKNRPMDSEKVLKGSSSGCTVAELMPRRYLMLHCVNLFVNKSDFQDQTAVAQNKKPCKPQILL